MELYIVRHGTTDWNAEKKFQGAKDIELNENGRQLAAALGERLDQAGINFDCVYSSPLIRAYETACLIRGHKTYPIIRNPLLTEISFGGLEGLPHRRDGRAGNRAWTASAHLRLYRRGPGRFRDQLL